MYEEKSGQISGVLYIATESTKIQVVKQKKKKKSRNPSSKKPISDMLSCGCIVYFYSLVTARHHLTAACTVPFVFTVEDSS